MLRPVHDATLSESTRILPSTTQQPPSGLPAEFARPVRILGVFPFMGHKGLVSNTLEKNVTDLPYVIVYRIEPVEKGELIVLAVFHGAQDRERAAD